MDRGERREFILATAMAIIDEQGHQGLTMRALARECEMSAPGVMHYFPDMPTLVVAVVAYRDQRDFSDVEIPQPGPGMSRLVLDAVIDNIVDRPKAAELFAIVEAQAIDPRHPGRDYFRERADEVAADFATFLAAEFKDPMPLAHALVAVMDGLQLNWLRDRDAFDLRERWASIAEPLFAAAEPLAAEPLAAEPLAAERRAIAAGPA